MVHRRLTEKTVAAITPSKKMMTFHDKTFPAFCFRVYPDGKRTFSVRFQHQGLRQSHLIGDAAVMSLVEARALAKDKIEQVRYGIKTTSLRAIPTLSAYAEVFFPNYGRHWKPSTLKNNRSGYGSYIDPLLGSTCIAALTRQHIEKWFAGMVDRQGIANRLLPVLSVMMQQAEKAGYRPVNSNPCQGIRRYVTRKKMERYLTVEELQRLWRVLNDHHEQRPYLGTDDYNKAYVDTAARMVIRLLLLTGCRSSEVRTLTWSNYRCGHWYLTDSKTGAKTVFLSTPVRELLATWPRYGKYLFFSAQPDRPLSASQLNTVWRVLRRQAHIADVRLHDLRHTYASVAIQQQVSLLTVGRLLGHALPETTLKYVHLAKDAVQEAAEHISRVLVGGMPV